MENSILKLTSMFIYTNDEGSSQPTLAMIGVLIVLLIACIALGKVLKRKNKWEQ